MSREFKRLPNAAFPSSIAMILADAFWVAIAGELVNAVLATLTAQSLAIVRKNVCRGCSFRSRCCDFLVIG